MMALLFCGLAAAIWLLCTVEHAAFGLRAVGYVNNTVALSYHLSLVVMLLSRISVSITLLFLGVLVDLGVSPQVLAAVFSIVGLVLGATYYFILSRWGVVSKVHGLIYAVVHRNNPYDAQSELGSRGSDLDRKFDNGFSSLPPLLVNMFVYLGLLTPSVLASIWPEHRAALMQTGFALNAIASLLLVLKVEKDIALVFEHGTTKDIIGINTRLAKIKGYGFLIASAFFACAYWVLD